METQDKVCTIHPYFKVHDGQLAAFNDLCQQFVDKTSQEEKALYYGFSFDGDQVFCREGYADAEGVLTHLANVGTLIEESLKIADLTRIEVHGPEDELAKLRQPMAALDPQFYALEHGFRR